MSEMTMDQTMPRGPDIAALCVSSVICADASYPVKVYCAMRSPVRNTKIDAPAKLNPVRFTNLVKT